MAQNKRTNKTRGLPFKWIALEYEYNQKSPDWFWAVVILTLAIAVTSFILKNLVFGILAIISGFTIILYAIRKPLKIEFSITNHGVQIGNKLYQYNDLESFWVHYNPPIKKELSLKSKKMIMPYIKIPLGDEDPNIIRELLLRFMQEKEHIEPFMDILMRNLKF